MGIDEKKEDLLRIFFDDGKTEVRPIDRVVFIRRDQLLSEENLRKLTKNIPSADMILVCIETVKFVQVYPAVYRETKGIQKSGR